MQSCQMAAYQKNKAKQNVNFLANGHSHQRNLSYGCLQESF